MQIINNQNNTNFKGVYNSKNFYQLDKYLAQNPTITGDEVKSIHESVEAYEALNRCINKGKISANQISDQMKKKFGVATEFHGDTFLACCAAFASNAMHKLGFVQPNRVSKSALESGVMGSCGIFDRNVTFADSFNWAKDAQDEAIEERVSNFRSSGHFLSTEMHEYSHSIHLNHLNDVEKRNRLIPFYTDSDVKLRCGHPFKAGSVQESINYNISKYGGTLPAEAFAEFQAKLICKHLDKKTLLPNYMLYFDSMHQPMHNVIEDFWNGSFNKYIQ